MTSYTNIYSYLSDFMQRAQSVAGYASQAGQTGSLSASRTGAAGQSFSDIYRNVSQRLNVPESMDAIFAEAAQKYQVPLSLLMAVGKAESNYNADAVSGAGACGVMQLMPATARSLGVTDPFDARQNIMGGAQYLSAKLSQYDGDIDLALAAYNAGSGNVAKYGGVPPFTETRNYIKRIREYMGTELTTGQTVSSGQTQARGAESASLFGDSDIGEISELAAQWLLGQMQLQMQQRADALSLSLSLASEEEEEENVLL